MDECQLCGEGQDELDPMGIFRRDGEDVIAHGQCGVDAGLDLA
jgi:hypothetical protein